MSGSSTPELPPQDLWSSILDSVSRSRSIPAKQVLILGQPSSGKSAIASSLLQKPPSDDPLEANLPDFALGYDWADVRDEGDEGETTLFRFLSMVTLKQLFFESRYLGTVIRLCCAILRYDLYLPLARFFAPTTIITAYSCDHCPRLDASVDLC
jgi:GTPase SAR1 family protein